MNKYLLLLSLQIWALSLFANELTPIIKQFNKQNYKVSSQNWSITQAPDGRFFFGNKDGLLEYDGTDWQLHSIPGNKIARAVYAGDDGKIYVGSYKEFGYFKRNTFGELHYTSFSDSLPEKAMDNDEIWNIIQIDDAIIFQSFTSFFIVKNDKVHFFNTPYTFLFFSKFKNEVYTNTDQKGFCKVNIINGELSQIKGGEYLKEAVTIIPVDKNNGLIVTKSSGLYNFDGNTITKLQSKNEVELIRDQLNRGVSLKNGQYALGSIQNGVSIYKQNGDKLYTINSTNALQNNTVLGLFCDRYNNLWVALDKGIAMIQLGTNIKYIKEFKPALGTIFTISGETNKFYIGSNQGLYKSTMNTDGNEIKELKSVPEIKGPIWCSQTYENQTIIGANDGIYSIENSNITKLSDENGAMCQTKGVIGNEEVVILGTYSHLIILKKTDNKWVIGAKIEGFNHPIKSIEIDYAGRIWAADLHQGLYKITLDNTLKNISNIEQFDTLNSNQLNASCYVFKLNNRVIFTNKEAFYTYDDLQKKIIYYDDLNNATKKFADVLKVEKLQNDLYWFLGRDEVRLYESRDGKINLKESFSLEIFEDKVIEDYPNLIVIPDGNTLITLENGMAIYSRISENKKQQDISIRLKSIKASDNLQEKVTLLDLNTNGEATLPYNINNLTFSVYSPSLIKYDNLHLYFKLTGNNEGWGQLSQTTTKEYLHLQPGIYTFEAQLKDTNEDILDTISYTITIKPPYYRSSAAYFIYFILLVGLIITTIISVKRYNQRVKIKIKKENEAQRRRELEKMKIQVQQLRTENLEAEVKNKSKELASTTLAVINKNEILGKLKEEIFQQKEALGNHYPKKHFDKLIHIIDVNIESEKDWELFRANFDFIHENFFRNLHKSYPELTSNDLRFCAFLRLNLSSKDIAHLMNISLKGVEVGRHRIRKKIELDSAKSLTEFMIEFK